VAQGAAIHAAVLEAKYRGERSLLAESVRKHLGVIKQEDVNSHGLGVIARHPRSGKYINHLMIPHNTRLPAERTQIFYTNEPNQQRVSIKVLEGDAPDPAACVLIGTCRVTGLPSNLPVKSPIEVTYSFDKAGRVLVRARDKTGGREATIEIERRGGLNEQQIDAFTRLASEYKVE
jgi:molecular chaperone DnaK